MKSGFLTKMLSSAGALLAVNAWAQDAAPRAGTTGDTLLADFRDPPSTARPRVWWHWMNGNITKDGIRKDLEWMKRSGIGGFQNFDANIATPQIVDKRLIYMTPEWKDALRFAASEADRLGLEMAIASSPGWSETGGPWVEPRDAMKKVVWSQVDIAGGRRFRGPLPPPPATVGPYRDIAAKDELQRLTGTPSPKPPETYGDIAVFALPAPRASEPVPRSATGTGGVRLDTRALIDGDLRTAVDVPLGSMDRPSSITYAFAGPRTVTSARLFIPDAIPPVPTASLKPVLEASNDGRTWLKVADFPVAPIPATIAFEPVTARHFRVVLNVTAPGTSPLGQLMPGVDLSAVQSFIPPAPKAYSIAEFALGGDRIDQFERKAGYEVVPDYYALDRSLPDTPGVPRDQLIDITKRMDASGSLDWTPPPGKWRVIRVGWSLTGKMNHPATPEATGLEVDKYDAGAVRRYLEHYIGMYRDAAGSNLLGKRGIQAFLTDSTEVGPSNWTPRLREQFQRLRGYDPMPYLPALTGIIVGSRGVSERFLFDYRQTLADLASSEHYAVVAEVARRNGLTVYGEALEGQRPSLGDDMTMRSHTDVPMAALWTFDRTTGPTPVQMADLKGAASVANIYGQNLVAAESMTSVLQPWASAPHHLRRIIDLEFASGINRPVIHTSVHQPLDDRKPGLSLSIFGQYFNRHEAWAEMSRPWMDYIARNSLMLQQGRAQTDVAFFYGEEGPISGLFLTKPPSDVPNGYGYDFASADVLQKELSVKDGRLITKGGGSYRLLYLGGSSRFMSLKTLRRISELVQMGATVVGDAPVASPSLGDDATEYTLLVRRLWNDGPVTASGAGRVIAGRDLEAALQAMRLDPDFSYAKPKPDSEVLFAHRRLMDGDAYFVSNRQNRSERIEARFRVAGKIPEIWRADTGTTEPTSYRMEGGSTVVPLNFAPDESYFVVFRKAARSRALDLRQPREIARAEAEGPWRVTFERGRGAPAETTFSRLAPLNENADGGIRYFSGTATYTTELTLPAAPRSGETIRLDLGAVGDVAEVRVNGLAVGTVWHAPWTVDVTKAVRRGRNTLEVRVANTWVNRLIGDRQPGMTKVAYTGLPTYTAKAPLQPAGLIGPVTLVRLAK